MTTLAHSTGWYVVLPDWADVGFASDIGKLAA
jgi:hypothetical protein